MLSVVRLSVGVLNVVSPFWKPLYIVSLVLLGVTLWYIKHSSLLFGASVTGEERVLMILAPDLAQSHLCGLADSQRLLHSWPQRLQQGFRRQLRHQGPIL
jgi:hypothetical protein